MQSSHVPDSWQQVRLGDFALSEKGKKPSNEVSTPEDFLCIPYIDIEAFEKNILKSWTDGKNCRLCFEDDFLMVWDGSRSGYIGKGMFGALGSTLVRINFPKINNRYAYYFLLSKYQEINTRAKGSGTPHVDPDLLWNYSFPIAPLVEQTRIVNKIEELFSEVDDGIQSLETAKKQLDIYRESILIQAFEGKLTEKWRNTQINKPNDSYTLIESINKSQEYEFNNLLLLWKENVKNWEKSTKIEKKPAKPTKPKPFDDITEEIRLKHPIPSNWALFRLGNLFSISPQNGLYKPADQYNNYSTRIIRIDSFYNGKITEVDNLKQLNVTDDELKTYQLSEHDLIINRVNSIEYLGKCAFVSKLDVNEPTVFESNIMRCKLIETVSPKYIAYYLSSIKGKNSLCLNAKHAVNQASINQTDVGNAIIPLPNFPEQIKVVELLEENFEKIQILEKEISNNLVILAKLKTSILTKAFLGELIPQDPNDEPASVLLERIKAEKEEELAKAKANKAPKKSGKRKTKARKEDEPAQQELI
ncbi:restriction endonuclease subunit S [Acinetobacter sp. YH1901136]|uniref:restriction endonuclease subunit S n=1 Tax=Acinetobacter sp. YH1901136 TaxID=2601200 RepID=UPI00211F4110|nr:restriction endonuclease subunit S [Acinetobacter sp. YH1901136]